VNTQIFS